MNKQRFNIVNTTIIIACLAIIFLLIKRADSANLAAKSIFYTSSNSKGSSLGIHQVDKVVDVDATCFITSSGTGAVAISCIPKK